MSTEQNECFQEVMGYAKSCDESQSLAKTEMGSAFMTSPGNAKACGVAFDPAVLNDIDYKARTGTQFDRVQCARAAAQFICGITGEGIAPTAAPQVPKDNRKECFCELRHSCVNTSIMHLTSRNFVSPKGI